MLSQVMAPRHGRLSNFSGSATILELQA